MINYKTILLKVKDMEADKVQSFEIAQGSEGNINGVYLNRNLISRVDVIKRESSGMLPESVFIKLYSGNFELGTIVSTEDYVLQLNEDDLSPKFYIREAKSYDYRNLEK
ncbi:hypothetical protein N4T77_19005 [Clostridium sp. CX1]|uniref:hypothetical protein n=1 Tax=Clostridium sp. CX1 TaxID=2978346 RepID=UPI0021BF74CE|nr:hypothetical protein [Clostridium sp. CX1]MCT8978683.1 hypothetical protein [Clostridium sp. CX1]